MKLPLLALDEVCLKITDGTHHSPPIAASGIPYVTAKHVKPEGLIFFEDPWYVSEADHSAIYSRCDPKKGDVLYIKDGATTGIAALNTYDFPFSMLSSVALLRPKPELCDSRFLCWWLNSPISKEKFIGQMGGAAIKRLTLAKIKRFEIPLPPLAEQRRIAEVLDKAEALRAKRRDALAQLDSLTQSLFLDLFGDPAFNERKWTRSPLSGVCRSPDHIKCGPFGTQLSRDEFKTEGVPLWGIKNVNKLFELPTHEFLEPRTAKRLIQYSIEPGDIVMTRKGTVGNCAVYPSNLPLGIMHSDLLRLRVNPETCDPIFLTHQLHYSRDVEGQLALISGGAVMPGINVTRLKNLEVLLPPLSLQREFARRVAAVEKLKTAQRTALAESDALFASLQHRAFRGKL